MRAHYHTVVLLSLILATCLDAQDRSQPAFDQLRGVVNRYLEVTDVVPCRRTVRVADSATILSSGDRVVMIQMQGARIVDANDASYGTIVDLNGAGSMEYLVVERIGGDSVIFTTPWVHTYDVYGRVQLVRVSRHVDAQIAATVLPQPWNGRTGGVVAIDVDNTLAVDADVSATAMGFRGGRVSAKKDVCNGTVWSAQYASGDGGQKGEGIASTTTGPDVCARGAAANGGGGGNGANAGGGGGGGGGKGGNGGDASSLCDPYIGLGGRSGLGMISRVAEQRLFMGGGGGGGHQNNDQGTSGATGGGIVMIRARLIAVTTGRIMSLGETVRDTSAWRNGVPLQPGDGTGGGGGGGSVMVDAETIVGNLTVNVSGGDGGHVGARYQPNGPGGGGGGGVALIPRPHPNMNVIVSGGNPGVHVSFETGPSVFRRPWGATAGDPGFTVSPFTWRTPTNPVLSVRGADTVCDGSSVVLTASDGFAAYRWSTGQSGQSITVTTQGSYTVTATDSAGCTRTPVTVAVGLKTASVDLDLVVNFGTTEVGVNRRSGFVVRNTSRDAITLSGIAAPPDVRVSGVTFPVVIPAGDSLRVDLEFIASRVMVVRDSLRVDISEPCAAASYVSVLAEVTADRVVFFLPDVEVERPSSSVSIPIRVGLESSTPDIRGIGLRLVLGIDARLFVPSGAGGAQIFADSVDTITGLRLVGLEIASADVTSAITQLVVLDGTALLSTISESPITIEDVSWSRPFGGPVWRSDTGRLAVGSVCGSSRRAVRFLAQGSMRLRPNPAYDHVVLDVGMMTGSEVQWSIIDALGSIVAHGRGDAANKSSLLLPLSGIAAGGYVMRLTTDHGVAHRPLIIQR